MLTLRLLEVPFTTLFEYLWMLRTICERLGGNGLDRQVMLYLAAAVSDFYIPKDQVQILLKRKLFSSSFRGQVSLSL